MFLDIILIYAAICGFTYGVARLIGGRFSEKGRTRAHNIALCIGLIAAFMATKFYSKWRTNSLTEQVVAARSEAASLESAGGESANFETMAGELSGVSLKGDRFTVKKQDVSIEGHVSKADVNWVTRDGRTNQTVKGFQCGKDLHATLYRSDKPTKYNVNQPDWHKVEQRGATREIYEWVCAVHLTGLTPDEGAELATEGGDASREAITAAAHAAQNNSYRSRDSEDALCARAVAASKRFDEIYAVEGQDRALEDAGGEENAIAASKTAVACQSF